MSIEEFESLSLTVGTSVLILYMLFIIYRLGKESRAGKFGYFVLFFALGLGTFGFVAKAVITQLLSV